MHASPLINAGGGLVHILPPYKVNHPRTHSYSHNNQSFVVETPHDRAVGPNKSISYTTTQLPLDLEAVGHEMERKRIKPNVYLKSGLIAAMASHRRSFSSAKHEQSKTLYS